MIDKVWDYGCLNDAEGKPPIFGYGIAVVWSNSNENGKETFQGEDIQKVKSDAIDFIINHYKSNKND